MDENTYTYDQVVALLNEHRQKKVDGLMPPLLSFKSARLSEFDFRGLDLSGVCFDNAMLVESNFNGCVLDDASFFEAYLHRSTFERSSLTNTDLRKAKAFMAQFIESRMEYAKLDDADFNYACFRDAILNDVTCARTNFNGAELPEDFVR